MSVSPPEAPPVEGIPETEESPAANDLDIILPPEGEVDVAGVPCTVRRLKTREIILVLRIFSTAFGSAMSEVLGDLQGAGQTKDEVSEKVMAMALMAIPEAGDDFVRLMQVLVEPKDRKLPQEEDAAFRAEMANPDIDITLRVVEVVVAQERDEFRELLGKVTAMGKRMGLNVHGVAGRRNRSQPPST